MKPEQAQLVLDKLKQYPYEDNTDNNDAITMGQRALSVVNEIAHELWYNGRAVDVDKQVSGADFIDLVTSLLENYHLIPQEVLDDQADHQNRSAT